MVVRIGCGAGGMGQKWLLGGSWVTLHDCDCVGRLLGNPLRELILERWTDEGWLRNCVNVAAVGWHVEIVSASDGG